MAWYDALLEQGAVPAGVKPKVITEPGGTPGNYQTDKLSTMLRGLEKFQKEEKAKEEERQKKLSKQVDMYKTLREAGYEPNKAYEAVMKGTTLPEPDAEDRTIPKTSREKILDKISRGEVLSEGEQRLYDETIKHKASESLADVLTPNQQKLKDRILDKIAKGQTLTPGEEKVYNETIKKSSGKGTSTQENLADVLGDQVLESDVSMRGKDMVPVIAPDGTRGWIPIKKLKKALAAGYKTRKKVETYNELSMTVPSKK